MHGYYKDQLSGKIDASDKKNGYNYLILLGSDKIV